MSIPLVADFRFSHERLPPTDATQSVGAGASPDVQPHTPPHSRSRMADVLANRLFLSDGGAFLITGYRGVGKTTFVTETLRLLAQKLEAYYPDAARRPVLLDVYLNIARPLSGVELMHFILRQLHNRLVDLKLLPQLPKDLRAQLRLAFLRTSAMLALKSSEEAETSISLDKWLSFSSKLTTGSSRDINYLAYDERSAENDLIALAHQLTQGFKPAGWGGMRAWFSATKKLKLLFVFDELDKIDESEGNESSLTDILHALKTLFTTSGISFIFVAGRALHERWKQDVQRGDSVFESVFAESHYLPAIWNQVDEICDPFLADVQSLDDYDRQLYEDFKRYLAYSGRGIPRRILRGFYERVRWDGQRAQLELTERDRRVIRFHAELYQMLSRDEEAILGENARELRPEVLDKQRLGLYYILDWILARGTAAFTLAELIDTAALGLKAGIAPAKELAPKVVTGLVDVLQKQHYLEEFSNAGDTLYDTPGLDRQQVRYRLPQRRLIEMGLYREAPPEPAPPEADILGGRYQLLDLLGQGASAQVYRALDRRSGRYVAVKRFNAEFFSADSSLQRRLRAEAEVQHQLRHPGIAELLDVEFEGTTPFIVMEYLDGVTLRRILSQCGRLPLEDALAVCKALLETLQYLHERGVIWRDVKPSNILITVKGRVAIVDFGTAQTLQNAQQGPDTTRVGFAAGTPAYMSPEQVRGEAQTPASDLFSLGIILYEMLVGAPPWPISNPLDLYRRMQNQPLEALSGYATLSQSLAPVLRKALSFAPEARFQQASEFLAELPPGAEDAHLGEFVEMARQGPPPTESSPDYQTMAVAVADLEAVSDSAGAGVIAPPPAPQPAVSAARPQEAADSAKTGSTDGTADAAKTSATEGTARRSAVEVEPEQMTYPRHYALLILSEPDQPKPRYFGLFGPQQTLGRSAECDIRLSDTAASRYHARIQRTEGGPHRVEDLNSSNGLLVNGTRIYQQQVLNSGDRIQIGQTELRFEGPEVLTESTQAETAKA